VKGKNGKIGWIAVLVVALGMSARTVAAADAPERIVSLNLCADQYLIELADKDQIAALSPLARNAMLSLHAEKADAYPVVPSRAAAVIAKRPDLVITSAFTGGATVAMLKRHDFRVLELRPTETFADVIAEIRTIAAAVGYPERGEAMIAALKRRMPAETASPGPDAPTALYYQRRGFATGTDSLINTVMEAAGLKNLMAEMQTAGTRRLSLESVVANAPDILIIDAPADTPDLGSAVPHHPALARLIPPERRVRLSPKLLFCAGPAMADVIDRLKSRVTEITKAGKTRQ